MKGKALLLAAMVGMTSLLSCAGELYVESGPPPLRIEVRPAPPSPDAVWIDGHWGWRADEYIWVEGHWERHPHGNWVPGRWERRDRGYVWVRGYWDHEGREHREHEEREAD